jgi:hypothetical protein
MCTNFAIASTTTYLNKIWQLLKNTFKLYTGCSISETPAHKVLDFNMYTACLDLLQRIEWSISHLHIFILVFCLASSFGTVYCLCKWRGQSLTLSVPHLSNSKWVYRTMLFQTNAAKHT